MRGRPHELVVLRLAKLPYHDGSGVLGKEQTIHNTEVLPHPVGAHLEALRYLTIALAAPPIRKNASEKVFDMAASHARPPTASRNASGTKISRNSSSDIEESGLPVALQVDVEAQGSVPLVPRHERLAELRVFHGEEDGILSVRLRLVREVDAGHEAL